MSATSPISSPLEHRSREPRSRRQIALGILAMLPVALVLGAFGWRLAGLSPAANGFGVNAVGQAGQMKVRAAPPIAVRTFDDKALRLADLQGQLVVLNFWGSWCAPCRQEGPALERIAQATRDQGVVFIGLDMWDAESDARRFLSEFKISYPNAPDPNGQIAIELGVTGIPETYFIDRQGQLVRRWVGPLTDDRLLALIAELNPSPTARNIDLSERPD